MIAVDIIKQHLAQFMFTDSLSLYQMRRILFNESNQSYLVKKTKKMPNGTISVTDSEGLEKVLHCAKFHYCLINEKEEKKKRKNKITATVYQPVSMDSCYAFQKKIFGRAIWNSKEAGAMNCLNCHKQCLQKAEQGQISVIPNTTFL